MQSFAGDSDTYQTLTYYGQGGKPFTDYGQVSWLRKEAALALSPASPDPWKVTPLGALLDERDVEAAEAAYATLSKWYAAERRVSA